MRRWIMGLMILISGPVLADGPGGAVIQATGIGRPPRGKPPVIARLMARRAAEVIAVRNLARKLGEQEGMGGSSFSSRVAGFRYLPPVYHADGTVEVTVEMPRGVDRVSWPGDPHRATMDGWNLQNTSKPISDASSRAHSVRRVYSHSTRYFSASQP